MLKAILDQYPAFFVDGKRGTAYSVSVIMVYNVAISMFCEL